MRAILQWFDANTAPGVASRVALDIADAARRAEGHPEAFAWVGSTYPQLAAVPGDVRRVLTRSGRHVVYYRYRTDADEVDVIAVRGAGQLPPGPDERGRTVP
jgi:plasmid stabilization system protein ParE